MAQAVRSILLSIGLGIGLSLIAYFGLPITTVLMLPGSWFAAQVHVPELLTIPPAIVASSFVYTASIWFTVQSVHVLVAVSQRVALAWMRSRL